LPNSCKAKNSPSHLRLVPNPPAGKNPDFEHKIVHNCEACSIRELALCSGLEGNELDELERIVTRIALPPGKTLFYEGDEARFVFNVTSGAIRLYKLLSDGRRQVTGFMLPGDYLGLSVHGTYAYCAEAIGETQLCRFATKDLNRLLDMYPNLEKRLLGITRDELAAAQDQMLLLGRKSPVEKVASFLLDLCRREERLGQADTDMVTLPMSRSDIADYLGLTVETVSRTFSRLKSENVLDLPETNRIVFKQREKLEELADGMI
jgi:CRP/FNR family transcriptional regulator